MCKVITFRKSVGIPVEKTVDKTISPNRDITSDKEEDNSDSITAAPNGQTKEVPGSLEKNDIVQKEESDRWKKKEMTRPDTKEHHICLIFLG